VAVQEVVAADGTSRALGAGPRLHPDPRLTQALIGGGATPVKAVSTDLFYDPREGLDADRLRAGADVVEMEAAALLALSAARGVSAAVALAVSDLLPDGSRHRIDAEGLEQAGLDLGRAGYAALTACA
jgi:uridine phosphorylase